MKTKFSFSNLLGTVYSQGNLLFTPDGTCLISPAGNRISIFDLINNKSHTLPHAHRRNIASIALNPPGNLLLSVDEDGRAILTHLPRRLALYHFSFSAPLRALNFSPSGYFFAAAVGRNVEIWRTPESPDSSVDEGLAFAPFLRHRVLAGHRDQVTGVQWSSDSRFLLSSSKDSTARIWSLNAEEAFNPTVLSGHRESVVGAWFSKDQEQIYTVSQDGSLFEWNFVSKGHLMEGTDPEQVDEAQMQWRITHRNYFMQQHAKTKSAAFDAGSSMLVAGFSNGVFGLYELPDFNIIHTLSISKSNVDVVALNRTAEWIAFGSSRLGQLLVWEWQSESYILKQQSHVDSITDLSYSPDGGRIITTADDGRIKVWEVQSGFCIVTFTEHSSCVTACEFAKKGNVLVTSSLDGSVRAWDLIRYRNFRTFSAPTRLSFSCVAIDPSSEVVCAGSTDSFDIYVWSMQTGQLLDQLSGHEGPVNSLSFAPTGDQLVSGSWDHTVRLWSIFNRAQVSESLQLQADVLTVVFRPDSKQIAVSTLDGQLTFWSVAEAAQSVGLDSRRDVSGGRKITDRRVAANVASTKAFATVTYSADGSSVIAGGNSKYICMYNVESGVLLKKFTISTNLSLEGTQEFLNSKNLTAAGPRGLIDSQGEESDLEDRLDKTLPGVSRGDASLRQASPEVKVSALGFSPTGQAFCAASTMGLLVYSTDKGVQFDPFDLEIDATPSAVKTASNNEDYLQALVLAFRLNETSLIRWVYESIPFRNVSLVIKEMPRVYINRLIRFVVQATEERPSLELNLLWIESLLTHHGAYLRENPWSHSNETRALQKTLAKIQAEIYTLANDNVFALDYLLLQPQSRSGFTIDAKGLLANSDDKTGHEPKHIKEAGEESDWSGLESD